MEKTYKISGMHCAACAVGIEKFLGSQAGIEAVTVNIATERMLVQFDEALISPDEIVQKVAFLSFGAEEYIPPERRSAEERARRKAEDEALQRAQRRRVAICLGLALPLFYICLSHLFMGLLPLPAFMDRETHPAIYGLVQLALTVPILLLGRRFYTGGIPALLHGKPTMDSLVALGTGSAFLYSLYSLILILLGNTEQTAGLFFDSSATVVTLVMLGKTLEEKSKHRTGDAIRKLRELSPEVCTVTRFGETAQIPASELRAGDIVTVLPGERFPCDGIVTEGHTSADLSMLTGESIPVELSVGDEVTGGSVNLDGRIVLTASGVGEDSRLAGIIRLVEDAQGRKAPIARLADRLAGIFVPAVLGIACISALIWALCGKDASFVLNIFVSVLVIACPCSLGLATPTAILCGTGRGAELGILYRSGEALQALAKADCVVLDKTGTLTVGQIALTGIYAENGDENDLLRIAAAAETGSSHPIAHAICAEAEARTLSVPPASDLQTIAGKGVTGRLDGQPLLVGNRALLLENGISIPANEENGTVMYCALGGTLLGRLTAADRIREDSREAVAAFHRSGVRCLMLTGDNEAAAAEIAGRAGLTEWQSGVLPGEKSEQIRRLCSDGLCVAMIGDGINDAPALAEASIGIAMGGGTDVAVETADVILTGNSLLTAAKALRLSRAVLRNIKENLFWAFIYNTCGIPFAAGLFYAFGGPLLNPMFAGAAMALSSICVVCNALRLKRWNK